MPGHPTGRNSERDACFNNLIVYARLRPAIIFSPPARQSDSQTELSVVS
jgi:hypothetical protein